MAGRPWCAPPPDSRTPHAGDPCAQRGHATVPRMESTAPLIHARVGGLQRTGYLTPYLAELIIDDVRRRGAGVCVEIRLGADADQASLDALDERLAALRRHGVRVVCRRERGLRRTASTPDAAA